MPGKFNSSFIGIPARKIKPTKKHRAAIWECMLGTVHAQNDAGEVKYFDYNYKEAKAFAGVEAQRDPRVFKCPETHRVYDSYGSLRAGKTALFIKEE